MGENHSTEASTIRSNVFLKVLKKKKRKENQSIKIRTGEGYLPSAHENIFFLN
jgi:hypothetical protein